MQNDGATFLANAKDERVRDKRQVFWRVEFWTHSFAARVRARGVRWEICTGGPVVAKSFCEDFALPEAF